MAEGGGNADERLIVMLEARISEFEKRMKTAERTGAKSYQGLQRGSSLATRRMEADAISAAARINQAMGSIHTQIGGFAKAFAGGLVVGALSGIASAARNAVGEMADLADLADQIGIDVENLQGLQQGLKLAGVEDATASLQGFTARLGDAAAGEGALADVMAEAGVKLKDRNGNMRDTLDILRDYADVVKNAPDAAAKMALVTEAFGKSGKAMVLAMSEGSAGIDGMIAEARAAGGVIDQDMIRKAAELDDKFDQVGARIGAIFKSGVISAAEFFGMFDRLDDLIPQGAAKNMLGDDLAAALEENSTALEKSKADLEQMGLLYDQLQQKVTFAADAISNEIPYLLELGQNDLALQLSDITGEMALLVAKVKEGKMPASELDAEMQKLITKAGVALDTANKIDGVNLDGAVSAVGGVASALQIAVDWSAQLLANMRAAAGLAPAGDMDTGTPLTVGGDLLPPEAISPFAPQTSDRPRSAPALLGEPGTVAASGAGKSKGGGGNSGSKVDAVLRDLQTEREAVTAWYAEASALLATATDAQLMQVGGRHEALERLETEHQERLRGIRDEAQGSTLAEAGSFFGAMATLTAAGNGKVAKLHRVAAAGEAFVNVLLAQTQVLADKKLGFWGKMAAFATIGAAGMGVVSALGGSGKSKGGGTSGGGAESAGSASASTADAAQSPLVVTLQGLDPKKLYEGSQIIALADALQKEFGKRGLQVGVPA